MKKTFLAELARLTPEQRASAYVELNCFEWPKLLAKHKPANWDEQTDRERFEAGDHRALWDALHEMTSEYERSRAWWLERLGRTSEEHLAWWAAKQAA